MKARRADRARLKGGAALFKRGDGEFIGFAVIAVCLCWLTVMLASFLTVTGALRSLSSAASVAARTAAVSGSLKDARENASVAAQAAVSNPSISGVEASVDYAGGGTGWENGTYLKVTVTGYVSTLGPLTSGVRGRSAVVCVDDASQYPRYDYSDAAVSDTQESVAGKAYSIFKRLGWPDEQIAGALGNIMQESRFDFTSVEKIYDEGFAWGEKKQAFASYGYSAALISANLGISFSGNVKLAGIGLIGWTDTWDGATGNTDLRAYALANGTEWYLTPDVQFEFMLDEKDGDSQTAACILRPEEHNARPYGTYDLSTVEGATQWWLCYVEGIPRSQWDALQYSERLAYAREWYGKLQSLPYDKEYAEGVLEAAGAAAAAGGGDAEGEPEG